MKKKATVDLKNPHRLVWLTSAQIAKRKKREELFFESLEQYLARGGKISYFKLELSPTPYLEICARKKRWGGS